MKNYIPIRQAILVRMARLDSLERREVTGSQDWLASQVHKGTWAMAAFEDHKVISRKKAE